MYQIPPRKCSGFPPRLLLKRSCWEPSHLQPEQVRGLFFLLLLMPPSPFSSDRSCPFCPFTSRLRHMCHSSPRANQDQDPEQPPATGQHKQEPEVRWRHQRAQFLPSWQGRGDFMPCFMERPRHIDVTLPAVGAEGRFWEARSRPSTCRGNRLACLAGDVPCVPRDPAHTGSAKAQQRETDWGETFPRAVKGV